METIRENVQWPGWETVRLIGQGSFGAVYEIQRELIGAKEKAALKVISIPQNDSDIRDLLGEGYDAQSISITFQSHLKSIVGEYSLMRKLNGSSNVVNCDDVRYVQHENGMGWDIFIKMELLTPLMDVLPKQIPEELALQIGMDICKALVLCAKHDIIHRDIKPQNIFVSPNGDYKLGDFGIAKIVEETTGGTKIGTPGYMAPEVYNNQPYGPSADICSLGLVMYWLLNERRLPFLPLPPTIPTPAQKKEAYFRYVNGEQPPAPKNGSEELKRIVLKACAYNPADRYHTAEELLADLKGDWPGPTPVPPAPEPIPPEPVPPKPEPDPKPHKLPWLLIAKIILPLLALAGIVLLGSAGMRLLDRLSERLTAHSWQEATCEQPETCSICGRTRGESLGHSWDHGTVIQEASVTAEGSMKYTCKTCGAAKMEAIPKIKGNMLCVPEERRALDAMGYDSDTYWDAPFWGQKSIKRSRVKKIIFSGTLQNPGTNAWDVSAAQDGSILAWMEGVTLHVATDGVIALNSNSADLFYYFQNLTSVDFGNCVDTSQVADMSGMFFYCRSLRSLDLSSFDTAQVTNMSGMFGSCSSLQSLNLSSFDTSQVTDMSYMFYYCRSLRSLDLSNFKTAQVTYMNSMFSFCSSLQSFDLSSFDTSQVTDMSYMFYYCSSLQSFDLSSFDTTRVTNMGWMFSSCSSLQSLDLSSFNTAQVTYMDHMFANCDSLERLNLSNLDTAQVRDISWMFNGCSSLQSLDMSSFDTAQVTSMGGMFFKCRSLQNLDLSNFDTAQVTSMASMFSGCSSLTNLKCDDSKILETYNNR